LEESKERELGEQAATRALTLNKNNPFATHAMGKCCYYNHPYVTIVLCIMLPWCCSLLLAHVIEEIYEAERGVEFMTSTRDDWGSTIFAGHLTWHLTLYYYGKYILQ
jgi:hypothetical protein